MGGGSTTRGSETTTTTTTRVTEIKTTTTRVTEITATRAAKVTTTQLLQSRCYLSSDDPTQMMASETRTEATLTHKDIHHITNHCTTLPLTAPHYKSQPLTAPHYTTLLLTTPHYSSRYTRVSSCMRLASTLHATLTYPAV